MTPTIIPLDLHYQGRKKYLCSYLLPHQNGAALVDCGPGSTLVALHSNLQVHGLSVADLTDVFITHIHLDHAGACGWLAQQGARVHVHPLGAPHLLDPSKLLASAGRIYGERMQELWGDFLAVPAERLSVLEDGAEVEVGGLRLRAIDTPGHANHHLAYRLEEVCFTGDVAGIRLQGSRYLRVPALPPEFHLEAWRQSIERLRGEKITHLGLTHFGLFDDPVWHLETLLRSLDELEAWMNTTLREDASPEAVRQSYAAWERNRILAAGFSPAWADAYEEANPSAPSADGVLRYWKKYRAC